jgi:hypothetical protein
VPDADVISTFWDGATCRSFVHEQPKTTKALLDIAIRHASCEEAVEATFTLVNVGAATGGGRIAPTSTTVKSTKKGAKDGKKGQKCRPCHLTSVTDNSNEGVKDSDEECVATTECDFKRCTRPPKDHFEKILEAVCPHHPYPVKHKLRYYTMTLKFMSSGVPLGGDEVARDSGGRGMVLGRWKSRPSPADYDPEPGTLCG